MIEFRYRSSLSIIIGTGINIWYRQKLSQFSDQFILQIRRQPFPKFYITLFNFHMIISIALLLLSRIEYWFSFICSFVCMCLWCFFVCIVIAWRVCAFNYGNYHSVCSLCCTVCFQHQCHFGFMKRKPQSKYHTHHTYSVW